jgi:hypothetical protein
VKEPKTRPTNRELLEKAIEQMTDIQPTLNRMDRRLARIENLIDEMIITAGHFDGGSKPNGPVVMPKKVGAR